MSSTGISGFACRRGIERIDTAQTDDVLAAFRW
jgi:hypothetical protein